MFLTSCCGQLNYIEMLRAKLNKVKEGESKSDRWTGKIDIYEAQEYN